MTKQATCEERIEAQWASLAEDLAVLFTASDCTDLDDLTAEQRERIAGEQLPLDEDADALRDAATEALWDQPLSVDRVRMVRVCLSTGGPSSEVEYVLDEDGRPDAATFVFKDWFDGARLPLHGEAFDLAVRAFDAWVVDVDSLR